MLVKLIFDEIKLINLMISASVLINSHLTLKDTLFNLVEIKILK